MWEENLAFQLQLACKSLQDLNIMINWSQIARLMANACQWAMIVYGATVDTTILSPPIILALGTLTFVLGIVDNMIEIFLRERNM